MAAGAEGVACLRALPRARRCDARVRARWRGRALPAGKVERGRCRMRRMDGGWRAALDGIGRITLRARMRARLWHDTRVRVCDTRTACDLRRFIFVVACTSSSSQRPRRVFITHTPGAAASRVAAHERRARRPDGSARRAGMCGTRCAPQRTCDEEPNRNCLGCLVPGDLPTPHAARPSHTRADAPSAAMARAHDVIVWGAPLPRRAAHKCMRKAAVVLR
jgi:hypothetical protein